MKTLTQDYDKQRIVDYMRAFRCGYKNRSPRKEIADVLNMDDRKFRELCADIPEIITSSTGGYYILPLNDPTGEESRIARELLSESRKRAVSLFWRAKKQRRAIDEMENQIAQRSLF